MTLFGLKIQSTRVMFLLEKSELSLMIPNSLEQFNFTGPETQSQGGAWEILWGRGPKLGGATAPPAPPAAPPLNLCYMRARGVGGSKKAKKLRAYYINGP